MIDTNERELRVLAMLSRGVPTAEIATRLCYSDRTIKKAIEGFMKRHDLATRTHAVAFALRNGLIR